MEKIFFYPLDITYRIENNKPLILIFGKTQNNKQICILDDSFLPYFYVPQKPGLEEKLKKLEIKKSNSVIKIIKIEKVKKKLLGKPLSLLKIYLQLPSHIQPLRQELKKQGITQFYEYDIPFTMRYMIDKNLIPFVLTEAEGEFFPLKFKIPSFKAKNLKQKSLEELKQEKILAFDIETYNPHDNVINPEKNPILMLSIYTNNTKKVLTWKKFKTNLPYIEFLKDEAELIQRFKEILEKEKPDIITGYFSDAFDLPYLKQRAKKHHLKLDLGLDNSEPKISGRTSIKSKINGLIHIDLFNFISKIASSLLDIDSYDLNSVAEKILGQRKEKVNLNALAKSWEENKNLSEFASYNLQDSKLAYELAKKFLPILKEMSKIVGLTLFDVNRMGFSQLVESYIMKQTPNFNEIIPKKPSHDEIRKRRLKTFKGAFVYEPKPGFYTNIVIFDFRSLYPSIISSHNISPDTLNCDCCKDKEKIPNEPYWFCKNKKGFISSIIEALITRRMRIKEIMAKKTNIFLEARNQSLKLLANAFYGYLGFFNARWYCLECAKSVTALGRYYIKKVITQAQEQGFEVIYSDTDSIFLKLGNKTKKQALSFCEKINLKLPGLMELEYEGFYPRGIFVSAKAGLYGAKKKYALLSDKDEIIIKGFETIRRNWSPIAKEVQEKVLNLILKENNKEKALDYVQKIIKSLKEKQIPLKKTIITTQLQKDIKSYASISPHVAVAKKMEEKGIKLSIGSRISFVVTKGKGRIRDRAKLPEEVKNNEYDPDYYINNQILPAVDKIFEVLGYSSKEILEKEQSNLKSFLNQK